MKIIGIGGLPRSGKDTLAEVFMANSFYGVSIGDIVRDEARVRHVSVPDPISIENLTETSNWLREQHGPDFALQACIDRYNEASKSKTYKGLVVFSVRMALEVDFIVAAGGDVIWVETDDDVRYERYIQHMREGETAISKAELMAQESKQWQPQPGIDPAIQMNTEYVKQHATKTFLNNDNDLEDFQVRAKALMDIITADR